MPILVLMYRMYGSTKYKVVRSTTLVCCASAKVALCVQRLGTQFGRAAMLNTRIGSLFFMNLCFSLMQSSLARVNIFEDLPLHGFEEPERSRRADQPGFHISLFTDGIVGQCLMSPGPNLPLVSQACEAKDGQRWVYTEKTRQLRLASDISLCLDVFGPHAGNQLGTYYCHGVLSLLRMHTVYA